MQPDTEKAPEPTPQHKFAQLCAELGQRQYLALKLSVEISAIVAQIDALGATPELAK